MFYMIPGTETVLDMKKYAATQIEIRLRLSYLTSPPRMMYFTLKLQEL